MNKLFAAARLYMDEMDLKDMAALKVCVLSLGTLFGLAIPHRAKKPIALLSSILFVGTLIPLTSKLFFVLTNSKEDV